MRSLFCLLVFLLISYRGDAELPWKQLLELKEESVRRDLKDKLVPPVQESIYSFHEAIWSIEVHEKHASGNVFIKGSALEGELQTMGLFNENLIIKDIGPLHNCLLLNEDNEVKLRAKKAGDFNLKLQFYLAIESDENETWLNTRIPPALKNSLNLTLPKGLKLSNNPGVKTKENQYFLKANDELLLHFKKQFHEEQKPRHRIKSLSKILIHEGELMLQSYFHSEDPKLKEVEILTSKKLKYHSTSLSPTRLKINDNNIKANISGNQSRTFFIRFSLTDQTKVLLDVPLPKVLKNEISHSYLIQSPGEGFHIKLKGDGLKRIVNLPQQMGQLLSISANDKAFRCSLSHNIKIDYEKFKQSFEKKIVLEQLNMLTSFLENGETLTVLEFEIDKREEAHLEMKNVPGAKLWSLEVNGSEKQVFEKENVWIIPLASEKRSKIKIAYLSQGESIKLHGKVSCILPYTGWKARQLKVVFGLPKRVELITLEGPVTSAASNKNHSLKELEGKPYWFHKPFYKGEKILFSLAYREPVKN